MWIIFAVLLLLLILSTITINFTKLRTTATVGTSDIEDVAVVSASNITIDNPWLHQWGDLGMLGLGKRKMSCSSNSSGMRRNNISLTLLLFL